MSSGKSREEIDRIGRDISDRIKNDDLQEEHEKLQGDYQKLEKQHAALEDRHRVLRSAVGSVLAEHPDLIQQIQVLLARHD